MSKIILHKNQQLPIKYNYKGNTINSIGLVTNVYNINDINDINDKKYYFIIDKNNFNNFCIECEDGIEISDEIKMKFDMIILNYKRIIKEGALVSYLIFNKLVDSR